MKAPFLALAMMAATLASFRGCGFPFFAFDDDFGFLLCYLFAR